MSQNGTPSSAHARHARAAARTSRAGSGAETSPDGAVRRDRRTRGRVEESCAHLRERRLLLLRLRSRVRSAARGHEPRTQCAERSVVRRADVREEHVNGHPLRDPDDERLERGRHVEHAPDEDAEAVQPARIGGKERIVRPVEAGAALLESPEDPGQRDRLVRRVRDPLQEAREIGEVVAGAAQLADQPVERLGQPGCLGDRGEVAVVVAYHLREQDAVGERRERATSSLDQRRCAKQEREVARHQDAHVGVAAQACSQRSGQVGSLQGRADEHRDRCQWVAPAELAHARGER